MADSIVYFLTEKLTTLLAEEAKLLTGVHDEVMSLRRELKFMILFLNNSQGKRKEQLVAEMVTQIRDVAHEAEDVVDTYVADITKRRSRSALENLVVRGVPHVRMLHNVAGKIEGIKTTINEIFNNKERYGMTEGGGGDRGEAEHIRKLRREVVGFESYSRAVIQQLTTQGSRLNVVSIIGMGGLGKTTLARKIYNDDGVRDSFRCRAWGYVSTEYRPTEFFFSLLECLMSRDKYSDFCLKAEETKEEDLKKKVRECLNGRKYLVVVDDVWQTKHWNEIETAFPDDNKGSRILITTRLADVAMASRTSSTLPYSLPFLNKPKSWELLSKKVFRGQRCPSDLVSQGKSIAENCDGLPLAITIMAGILAKNKRAGEWSKIKDHVDWHLGKDNTLKDILKLSYDDMPPRLKPCFLYFGMYPEDHRIPAKQLIQLWISEGFLTQEASRIPNAPALEFIAEGYLRELVNRSLVQVVRRTSDGAVKTCRIHNVLRHLCISESKEDKFFDVCVKVDSETPRPRRLSLHGSLFNSSSSTASVSGTRSLLCFSQEVSEVKQQNWTWLLKSFKLARVLDLGRMNVNSFPDDLKSLIHLRYLRINSHNLETIPDSICRLWNLETLDLRGSRSAMKSFSGKLWQLKKLRHLLMVGPVELPEMPHESETMPNLQTLSTVVLDVHTASWLDNGKFPGLTKLGLHYQKRGTSNNNPRVQLQSLGHLKQLRNLKVIGTTEIPQNTATVFPSSITKITVERFGFFNSSAMSTLGKLPNLLVLKVVSQKSNVGFDVHCAAGGFPQLQVFAMVGIKVKTWRVDRGSMARLGRVLIRNCSFLTELPKELWSLRTLWEVNVSWPSTELAKSLGNLDVNNQSKIVVYPLNKA